MSVSPEECRGCGVCCLDMGTTPIPPHHIVGDGGPCLWLTDEGCLHYDRRFPQCRDLFDRGGAECVALRVKMGVTDA